MKTSFPKSKIEVVLLEGIHDSAAELFRDEGFSVRTEKTSLEGQELLDAIRDAHILGIRSKTQITPEVIAESQRLLALGCFCIGTNQVALQDAAKAAVPVFNAPFSNTRSVAELTIAETIMLSRRTFERAKAMHEGTWSKSAARSHEIRGKVMGIVGYGHIGSQVSVLAEAMGMHVIYFDVAPKLPLGNATAVRSLEELLDTADIVTLHVPATPQTAGMIGREEIRRMKRTAHLINNARGSVVDVDALAVALREERLAGAALDVFPDEPAAREATFVNPLQGIANVILTPHVGGSTQEAQENIGGEVAAKLTKFINNGSTTGAVNVPNVDLPEQSKARYGFAEAGDDAPRPHRILHFHQNTAGVLAKVNNAISELGVNVAAQHLQTAGELGYVVLDVDPSNGNELKAKLNEIPETIRTRILW